MEKNTAKHFVLQLGSLISLYLSLSFLITLLFGIINLTFPNASEGYWVIESASNNVRLGIAMVIVFFPTYIMLTRAVNRTRRTDTDHAYLSLTKWLIYLSLLVGGGILLGDLAVVIMTFLNGDITIRFILKAVTMLVIIGFAFYYYLLDAQGYWIENEKRSVSYGVVVAIIVLAVIIFGFFHIATPGTVAAMKLDEKQIQDLQQIQWKIESVISTTSAVPATLEDAFVGFDIPVAPAGREDYTYQVTDVGFQLCATFSQTSEVQVVVDIYANPVDLTRPVKNADSWQYKAGRYCFERIIK